MFDSDLKNQEERQDCHRQSVAVGYDTGGDWRLVWRKEEGERDEGEKTGKVLQGRMMGDQGHQQMLLVKGEEMRLER